MTTHRSDVNVTVYSAPGDLAGIDELVHEANEHDGVAPLNEASLLRMRDPEAESLHVRATSAGRLVGYALAYDDDGNTVAEGLVAPSHRRNGTGTRIADAVLSRIDGAVHVWAHGDLAGAAALAAKSGLSRVRVLLRMEATFDVPVDDAQPADGVTIRTFRPGVDDQAWLALNARAFADHPEQGSMTQHDLEQRMASEWFDPEGFFLAEREGELVGFHWTKVSAGVGEVYVVGVDQSAQGLGLGSTLTRRGLAHLTNSGVRTVELYVEGDNEPALAMYRRLGFHEADRDVMYARQT